MILTCACGAHDAKDFREIEPGVFLCGWCKQRVRASEADDDALLQEVNDLVDEWNDYGGEG